MSTVEERGGANGEDAYTQDGTVDRKGGPVRRSRTGRWKACSFIVGCIGFLFPLYDGDALIYVAYEVFERISYYGVASNLLLYLTKRLREGTVNSANNVTNWAGVVWMTPVIGAYIGDVHLGRYRTFVIASIIYLLVRVFPRTGPPRLPCV
ncbi:hypothetical protein NL676_001420 [Syzygium grande]|nr:hypothetical protein NL676_001420 [Syzygium grande]